MKQQESKARSLLKTVSAHKAAYCFYYDLLRTNGKKGYCAEYKDRVVDVIAPLCQIGVFSSPKETDIDNVWGNCCYTLDSWNVINRDGSGYHELTDQSYTNFSQRVGHSYLDKVLLSISNVILEELAKGLHEENKTFREVIEDLVTKQKKIKELLD